MVLVRGKVIDVEGVTTLPLGGPTANSAPMLVEPIAGGNGGSIKVSGDYKVPDLGCLGRISYSHGACWKICFLPVGVARRGGDVCYHCLSGSGRGSFVGFGMLQLLRLLRV